MVEGIANRGPTRRCDQDCRFLCALACGQSDTEAVYHGDPGGFLIGAQREFCRAWPKQQEVTVKGAHFLQEDAPHEVGEATARFVAKVLAGQIF